MKEMFENAVANQYESVISKFQNLSGYCQFSQLEITIPRWKKNLNFSFLLFSQQNTPNPCGLSWLTLTFLTFHGPMVSSDLSWFFQVLHPGLLLVAPMRAVVALEVRLT